eukprot:389973-Prorocentrum_minimum.AAC.1
MLLVGLYSVGSYSFGMACTHHTRESTSVSASPCQSGDNGSNNPLAHVYINPPPARSTTPPPPPPRTPGGPRCPPRRHAPTASLTGLRPTSALCRPRPVITTTREGSASPRRTASCKRGTPANPGHRKYIHKSWEYS